MLFTGRAPGSGGAFPVLLQPGASGRALAARRPPAPDRGRSPGALREDDVRTSVRTALVVALTAAVTAATTAATVSALGARAPETHGTTALVGRAVLPADTFRPGSAPSGALLRRR
jgi:hypothetical protein